MLEKIKKFRDWLDEIEQHYKDVQRAWKLINDKCKNKGFRFMYDDFVWHCIDSDVKNHDESKLSAMEFTQYRNFFHPCDGEQKNKEEFKKAWEHHKKHNAHHWEHWTQLNPTPYDDAFLVMNVIDWVAMGFRDGFSDAKTFYESKKDKINFPDWAIDLMYKIFDCIYPID